MIPSATEKTSQYSSRYTSYTSLKCGYSRLFNFSMITMMLDILASLSRWRVGFITNFCCRRPISNTSHIASRFTINITKKVLNKLTQDQIRSKKAEYGKLKLNGHHRNRPLAYLTLPAWDFKSKSWKLNLDQQFYETLFHKFLAQRS